MRCAAPRRLNGNPPSRPERYEYRDRPPLKDTRNWLRTAAVALGVLLVFAVGAGIYSFWPRSLDDVRSMAKQRNVSSTSEPAEIKSDFVRLRQLVYYRTTQPVGTIVVDKSQTFLYVVRPNLSALRYSIGVGTECTALSGLYHVARKEELPGGKPSGQQPARFTRPLPGQGGLSHPRFRRIGQDISA